MSYRCYYWQFSLNLSMDYACRQVHKDYINLAHRQSFKDAPSGILSFIPCSFSPNLSIQIISAHYFCIKSLDSVLASPISPTPICCWRFVFCTVLLLNLYSTICHRTSNWPIRLVNQATSHFSLSSIGKLFKKIHMAGIIDWCLAASFWHTFDNT